MVRMSSSYYRAQYKSYVDYFSGGGIKAYDYNKNVLIPITSNNTVRFGVIGKYFTNYIFAETSLEDLLLVNSDDWDDGLPPFEITLEIEYCKPIKWEGDLVLTLEEIDSHEITSEEGTRYLIEDIVWYHVSIDDGDYRGQHYIENTMAAYVGVEGCNLNNDVFGGSRDKWEDLESNLETFQDEMSAMFEALIKSVEDFLKSAASS